MLEARDRWASLGGNTGDEEQRRSNLGAVGITRTDPGGRAV